MAEGDEPRIVATFNSYAGMLEAIRARVNELQINGERFDEYAGLPGGYLSKLIGAKPVRKIGMTTSNRYWLVSACAACWSLTRKRSVALKNACRHAIRAMCVACQASS